MTPEVGSSGNRVLAVVVAYRPEPLALRELLQALLAQVEEVLVVDNTPAVDDRVYAATADMPQLLSTLRLLRVGHNVGIAAALNIGIDVALSRGFDYVLLSDQDSEPAADMCLQLLSVAQRLVAEGVHLGLVGPVYVDRITGQTFGFQVKDADRMFYRTLPGDRADPWAEVLTQITSGSLIPSRVFADVGLMDESLFIDDVDADWCHRARHFGYRIYGTSLARMGHSLGDNTFRVWYLRWRPFSGYPPLRLYYRFRNFVLMTKRSYVPLHWKLRAGWYWLGNAYAYLLFSPDRIANLRYISRGLWDGLRGRSGPLPTESTGARTVG